MTKPVLLYRDEVESLTGWGPNKARNFITDIWLQKGLPRQRWVWLSDFCRKCQMTEEMVLKLLQEVQRSPRKQS